MAFRRIVMALSSRTMVQGRNSTKRYGNREGPKRKKAMKAFLFNLDSHPLKHPMKKVMAMPGNQMTSLLASGLTTL